MPWPVRAERRLRIALGCCALVLASTSHARAALCGDTSGDGFFTAFDALKTLKLAVSSIYDRRGDVFPDFGDAKITASDALRSLRRSVGPVEDRFPKCHGATATRAVVTTAPSGFDGSGGFAVVDIAKRTFRFRAGAIHGDSVVRVPSGIPVVVNREGSHSLQLLDIGLPSLPTIKSCSVSDGFYSNPQDVLLFSAQKGYVTPYKGMELFVIDPEVLSDPAVDPACSSLITGRIDLSQFDDDGIPQMDQMVVVGTDLFVTLQLLEDSLDLPPKQNGVIAVIDTTTDTLKGSIPLSFENPFAATKGLPYDEFQKLIFAGGPGNTGITGDALDDGAIEAVDPATMQSAGVLLTGADIHANIFDFVIAGTDRAFAIIADKFSNSVVDIDLKKRSIRQVLLSSTALITDIEMTELGELWVAYRGDPFLGDPSGLRIFRVGDDRKSESTEVTAEPISLGQAPFTLAFID